MKKYKLILNQMDAKLHAWQRIRNLPIPREGWIRSIRKTLGLTTEQLATKLGVNRSRVVKIEQAELQDAITLKSLRNTAKSLNCDLFYALVPKKSFKDILLKQAQKIAQQKIAKVSHNMTLEKQTISLKQQQQQYQNLVTELLEENPKYLWNDNNETYLSDGRHPARPKRNHGTDSKTHQQTK